MSSLKEQVFDLIVSKDKVLSLNDDGFTYKLEDAKYSCCGWTELEKASLEEIFEKLTKS